MPEGDVLETLDGIYSGLSYYSTASDGALSVGVLWRYAKACEGWVAKVKCVSLTDMQVTGAASSYEGILASPKSKAGVILANVVVNTEGMMNPDYVTGIKFTLPANEDVIDPHIIKVVLRLKMVHSPSFSILKEIEEHLHQTGLPLKQPYTRVCQWHSMP